MTPTMRGFRDPDDYWRIREFLRELFRLNGRRQHCWDVVRWDYWRCHTVDNTAPPRMQDDVMIWEAPNGRIAAVLNGEDRGQAFLQVHPDLRTPAREEEMLAMAEERLAVAGEDGRRTLRVWSGEHDDLRQELLVRRGHTRGKGPEYQRRRPLSRPIADVPLAEGFTVRSLGDVDEHPARSWLSWRAFHPNEPDNDYQGWAWYGNIQRGPLYRRDLDLMAVAPDGALASFCTVWLDDVNRTGVFEPVGTAPEYQRRGLARATMTEGLRRLVRLGATLAFVGSYSEPAHALYASVGFAEYDRAEPWVKAW